MALVGMKEINGEEYEIHASKYGTWSIQIPSEGDEAGATLGSGDTFDKAVANARVQINKNKVKLHIPFVTRNGEHGIATGKHGRTREILAVINGDKTTFKSYEALRGDTPQEEIDRLIEVQTRIRKLQAEEREIINEYKFNLGAEVEHQIAEAAKGKSKQELREAL